MSDLISRQAAIDAPEKFIKDCNPEHFVGHQKFIEFMDDAEIGSFGNLQFANGFNMGLTAAEVATKNLPSAQPERKIGRWIDESVVTGTTSGATTIIRQYRCSVCGGLFGRQTDNYCYNCGAKMEDDHET